MVTVLADPGPVRAQPFAARSLPGFDCFGDPRPFAGGVAGPDRGTHLPLSGKRFSWLP
jgi:hypothetical protein